ncbi:hypothetical protein [Rickettsiella endosymbiont of Miltochrista miniata]|uniref:hypothetical protein n=1 Tax=Rickettsiella endosymbiont of Miltochrista miniata TaxID=3066239 RepID=UPI00313B34D2
MPALSNINVQKFCDANQALLRDQRLVEPNHFINLIRLNPEEQKNLVNQLIENEKSNVEASEENYQKGKHKAKHINMLLISALALLVAGFTLAPLFVASPIVIPILPVLLFGVAIIAITKFFLNIKNNRLEVNAIQADKVLNQLKECKEVDGNVEEEVIRAFNNAIRNINSQTEVVGEKIKALEESSSQKFSQLLDMFGKFRPSSPTPIDASANEVHILERVPSPTHN